MPSANPTRVQSHVLDDDIDAYLALLTIKHYAPNNPDHRIEAITAAYDTLRADEAHYIRIQVALDAARDALATSRQHFHTQMLSAKTQVRAQFGPDSNEVAALGLKKKSEHKPRSRGPKGEGAK